MKSTQTAIKTKSNNYISDTVDNQDTYYQSQYMHPVQSLLPADGSGSGVAIDDNTPAQTLNNAPAQPSDTTPMTFAQPTPGADPILQEVPMETVNTAVEVVPDTVITPAPVPPEVAEHIKKNWWIYLLIAAAVIGLIVAYKKGYLK